MGSYTGDLQCLCAMGTFCDYKGNTSKMMMTRKRSSPYLTSCYLWLGVKLAPCKRKFCICPCTGSNDTCSIFVGFLSTKLTTCGSYVNVLQLSVVSAVAEWLLQYAAASSWKHYECMKNA